MTESASKLPALHSAPRLARSFLLGVCALGLAFANVATAAVHRAADAHLVVENVAANSTVTLIVPIPPENSLQFQWTQNKRPLRNGPRLTGAHSAKLTLRHVRASDEADYQLSIASPGGTTLSNPIRLRVGPLIVQQPRGLTVRRGATATLRVLATGDGPLRYRWYKNGVRVGNGGRIRGATAKTLTLRHTTLADAGLYNVQISNHAGPVVSRAARLRVR